jgi:hypothetical protein
VQPGEKKKVFKDSFVPNIQEFIDTFGVRNLTNDAELGVLVEQARNIIAGVDNQALRDDEGLREKVNRQFEQVRAQLDTMICRAPRPDHSALTSKGNQPTPGVHATRPALLYANNNHRQGCNSRSRSRPVRGSLPRP